LGFPPIRLLPLSAASQEENQKQYRNWNSEKP
jgi:hypothetical protein